MLYFKFVPQNWIWFQLIGLSLNIFAFLGCLFIPESPEYLYSFYRFDDCRGAISQIAKWNKKHENLPLGYRFDVESELKTINITKQIAEKEKILRTASMKYEEHSKNVEVQKSVQAGIRHFINHEDPLVSNLIVLMVLWMIVVMNYQINAYYYDAWATYDDVICITIVELIGYIVSSFIFQRLRERACTKLYLISFVICSISGLVIYLNDANE